MGHPNHEERGIKVIQTDEDIHESFDLAEVETDDVVRVIREEGLLGQLMSVADTLSYVVLDSHVTPLVSTIPFELIWQVVGSIDGVEDDRYRVSSIDPLLKLVWHRADLYRDLYAAYPNRISAFVLRNFYRATIELNVFSAQDFIQGTDGDIKMLLPFKLQDPQVQARLPDWFSAVRDMAFGFFWTPDRWQHLRLNSEVKARAVLNRLNQSELDTSVLIPPFDYRRKTYRVIELVDGDKVDLQAPESHVTGEHLLWHVLYLAS